MFEIVPEPGTNERRVEMEMPEMQRVPRRGEKDRHMASTTAAHHSLEALQISRIMA